MAVTIPCWTVLTREHIKFTVGARPMLLVLMLARKGALLSISPSAGP